MQVNTSYAPLNSYATMNIYKKNTMPYDNKITDNFVDEKEEAVDYNKNAFESVAPNAPDEVKEAWMETAKEVGVNGMGMQQNGMVGHITQMAAQKAVKWYNGERNYSDILGNSVESAIQQTKKALYDLENPLTPNSNRPIEVQQQLIKEKEFYEKFLEKLEKIETEK